MGPGIINNLQPAPGKWLRGLEIQDCTRPGSNAARHITCFDIKLFFGGWYAVACRLSSTSLVMGQFSRNLTGHGWLYVVGKHRLVYQRYTHHSRSDHGQE